MAKKRVGTYTDDKGYLRISAGPCRGMRVHTLVAEAMLGRKLHPDEQVHHRRRKDDPRWENLIVLAEKDHGAVSAKQAWYFKEQDVKAKKNWDEFFKSE